MSSLIAFGLRPSTWQPVLKAVPRTSFTVPFNSFDMLLKRIFRAISMISSNGIDLLCLMFFSFFRSRGGSLSALMTREDAEGTMETAACRFWMVRRIVTRRPFWKLVSAFLTGRSKHVIPSRQSLSQCLRRPSLVKDQADQSWAQAQMRNPLHHQWP